MPTKKKPTPKKAKAKATPKKKPAPKLVTKGPRQKPLPGMEDRSISALDEAALSYDEIKKERMGLTLREVDAKATVSTLMHKAKKVHYKHNGITIDLVPEGEKVKVKIAAEGDEEDEPDTEEIPDMPDGEEVPEPAGEYVPDMESAS